MRAVTGEPRIASVLLERAFANERGQPLLNPASADRRRVDSMRPPSGAPFSQRVLYATLLWNLELFDEARPLFRALSEERPDASHLRRFAR